MIWVLWMAKQGGAEPPRMIGYQPTIKSHADTMQLPVNLGLGMAILPSVNVTWDSFTPSEVNMAEVACCKELTCVLSDWMIFKQSSACSCNRDDTIQSCCRYFQEKVLWNLK